MSTTLQGPDPAVTGPSGMSVAVIGPNNAHRKIVAKALGGSQARTVREFSDYPASLSDVPSTVDQQYDVVMIDVDSDQSYALALIESIAALGGAMVVAYSKRNDPDLLLSCMRAGAREFLPLPDDAELDVADSAKMTPQSSEGVGNVRSYDGHNAPEMSMKTSAPDVKSAGDLAQSLPKAVRQPDAAPLDFNAWDDAHLRPLQRGNSVHRETSSRSEPAPEPIPKSEKKRDKVWIRPASNPVLKGSEATAHPEISPETPVKGEKEWDSLWIRPHTTVKAAEESPRSGTAPDPLASMKSTEASPQSKSGPELPAKSGSWLDAIDNATQTNTRPRPRIDRSAIEPIFHYVEPEDNKKPVRNSAYLVILAAGSGMLVGLLLLLYMRPFGQHAADAPAVRVDVSQPMSAPAANHSARAAAKPSAAVPAAKPVVPDASTQANPVASDMMDAQLAAPARITSDMKKPRPVEEPPAGFAPGGIDDGGSGPGPVFGSGNRMTVVPAASAISAGVAEGMLIHKIAPVYPQFAKESHLSGTVVLGALSPRPERFRTCRLSAGQPFCAARRWML